MYNNYRKYVYLILTGVAISMMIYAGIDESRLLLNLLVFFIVLPFGFIVKHTASKFILVYGYFVSELIVDEVYRMIT